MIDMVKFSKRERGAQKVEVRPFDLKRLRDPHALVHGTHGVEFGGFLGAADDVGLDAAAICSSSNSERLDSCPAQITMVSASISSGSPSTRTCNPRRRSAHR